ncbi:MAG TPA: hypothetical protein DCZ91_25000 [Lachnospiraceae bacterium]|nr:hypothetical protein [Lachnospiraceae bacterium]
MKYFPMFMDIKGRRILICGGGKHALEKAGRLAPFGAQIHVISENISAEMEELGRRSCRGTADGILSEAEEFGKRSYRGTADEILLETEEAGEKSCGGAGKRILSGTEGGEIVIEHRRFSEKDLTPPPVFVIAAEERNENERIADLCRKENIPVNAVDMQDICDFIFPAMITTGQMCIGISTGGLSPAAAVELKQMVSEAVPDNIDDILEWMVCVREEVRRRIPKEEQRLILREIVRRAFAAGRPLTEDEIRCYF